MATERLEICKCQLCGIIAEVLERGAGEMICCGEPMTRMTEKTSAQEGKEKHVPVVEIAEGAVTVKVGSVPHPMEQKHFIQWIEVISDGVAYRQFLKPGDASQATFNITAGELTVREYCNLHGLWKA